MANLKVHPTCKEKFAFAESCFAPSVLPYFEFWLHQAEPNELRGFKLLQLIFKDNGTKIVRTRGSSIGPRDSPMGRTNVSNFYFNLTQSMKLNKVDKEAVASQGIKLMPCSRILKPSALQLIQSWLTLENPEESVYAVIECLRGIYSAVRIQTDLPDHKNRRNYSKFNFSVSVDPPVERPRTSASSAGKGYRQVTTDKRYSTAKKMQFLKGAGNLTNWVSTTQAYGKSNYQEQYVTQNMSGARPSTHFGTRTSTAVTICPDTLRFDQTFYRALFAARPEQ